MSKDPPIAYVLLSGGIDSTTALARAVDIDKLEARCVSIDYGQRHRREIGSASVIAEYYSRPHRTLPLVIAEKTMLIDDSIQVPDISYAEIAGVSPTYVPFRNGMMLSRLAAHISEWHFDPTRSESADYGREAIIYWGAHAEDAQNWAYPDCTPEFIGAMANAIYIGTYHKVRVVAPFQSLLKHEIIEMGAEIRAPYRLTWSCYKGGETHCGTCATCLARKDAFLRAGVQDPTEYLV